MILLESGPAKTDRYYWLIVGLAFLGFAGLFVKDGAYGYRDKNRKTAEKELLRWSDPPFQLGETLTLETFENLKTRVPIQRRELYDLLGQPLPRKKDSTGPLDAERFASVYGMAVIPIEADGKVSGRGMQWIKWFKTKEEIKQQYYWALIPIVLAIYLFIRAYKAAKLRAVIDDEGMTYGGLRIRFSDMLSLRDYNRRGWVDLYYKAAGEDRKLRIDNQKIAKFNEIAELLCEKKGFENPIKAAQQAEQSAIDDGAGTPDAEPTGDTEPED